MKLRSKLQLLSLAASTALFVFAGCQSASVSQSDSGSTAPKSNPSMLSADVSKPASAPAKGRAQLWSETCNRCHNTRSPSAYGAREWAIVMTHMRVRGYLNGEDQRAILEFLQSQ